MANTRTQLPFKPGVYKKIKRKHRIEIGLRVVFNILAGLGVVTGWTNLSAILGVSLLLGSGVTIGSVVFAAMIGLTALAAIFWVINSAISQSTKAKKEIELMQKCDDLYMKINRLLANDPIQAENLADYKNVSMHNNQTLSPGRLFGRLTNYFMSFMSAFNSTLGLAVLICGAIGLGSLFLCTGGMGILAGFGVVAVLMGVIAVGTENYFKQARRNRIFSLRNKVDDLKKTKTKIKKTIRQNKINELKDEVATLRHSGQQRYKKSFYANLCAKFFKSPFSGFQNDTYSVVVAQTDADYCEEEDVRPSLTSRLLGV